MRKVDVLFERVHPLAQVPAQAHPGDAGWDLFATEAARIAPGERAVVGTGLRMALPPEYVALVHTRSGRALREGLTVVNAPGVIDCGYRGEIKVILGNTDREHVIHIEPGERIAQLIVQRFTAPCFVEVTSLPGSQRQAAGFGSTGRAS
jgi:dUTP pyrophosphatase